MNDPPLGRSQVPSNSRTQPMNQMEQLLQLRKTLEVCQSTGKSLMDDVDEKISIVKLSEDVEKLHGQISNVSSEVNSINTRTGSMESVLEKLLENSNKTLENHSSLEATITKSNADVEAIKQHIQMFDSHNFQEKYSRIEQAVITSAGGIEKINQHLEAFDSNKILEKQSSLEQTVINSTCVVQEIKHQLEAKAISDEADLRKLMEMQNRKLEEHKNEIVTAINEISQNVEASQVNETRHSAIKQLQEKLEARSISSKRVSSDSVPEVVLPSTVVSPVENFSISKPDVSAGEEQELGEQSGGGTTPLAITIETVPAVSQPPIDKNSVVVEPVVGGGRTPVQNKPPLTSDLSEGQQEESEEQNGEEITPLAITIEAVPAVSQSPIDKNSVVVEPVVVKEETKAAKSRVKRPHVPSTEPDQTLTKFPKRCEYDGRDSYLPPQNDDFAQPLDAQAERAETERQAKTQVRIELEQSPRATPAIHSNIPSTSSPTPEDAEANVVDEKVADASSMDFSDNRSSAQKPIEREETTPGISSNYSDSVSTAPEAKAIVVDKEMTDAPIMDSSDHRTDELPHNQPAIGNELYDFEAQHKDLDAMPEKEEGGVQREEVVIQMENDQDPVEDSEEFFVPPKKRKRKGKKGRLTTRRAPKKNVEVFNMEEYKFEWGSEEIGAAEDYQEDDGTNKIDVFIGKPAAFWKTPDEVMKKLVEQSAAYTANGMVRFAYEEPQCTYADEKQRENVSAFLESHTSAIDPGYWRTTVDPETYKALDSEDFRYCQHYFETHTVQEVTKPPLPMNDKNGPVTPEKYFPRLPTTAVNHQSFTLNSADVAALAMESHGKFDQIYTPMNIQKLEPNRELVAAEQELFKNDNPELASKRHRLPAIHVEIKTKEDLHSPNLKKVLDSSPISVLSGVGKALGIDLKTLTSERLAATVPNLIVDVMLQVAQPVHQNITIYGMKEWETQRKYCSMTSAQFEEWKRNEQKAARKLLSLLKKCDPKHAPAMVQDFMKKRIKAPYSFEGEEKEYSWTPFATNIDLTKDADNSRDLQEGKDHFKEQTDILNQLPAFMQATDRSNLLAHIHSNVFGVNTVQMYSKFIGSLTAAHMENSLMASINWNVGPASCIWYAIPYEYWTQLEKLVKEKGQKYHHQNYWPSEEDIKKAGIPLIKFEQREDELVYVNTGTFHWVQAEGYCTNVSWNVGPANFNQLAASLISAAHNRTSRHECHIPITNVIWNAAEERMFMDEPLMYSCMRWHMQRSLAWCIRYIAWIESNGYEFEDWTDREAEYIYRCGTCKQEVFNICKVLRTGNDKSKDIIFCPICKINVSRKNKRQLFVIYKNVAKLRKIYDSFVREIPEEGIQQDQ